MLKQFLVIGMVVFGTGILAQEAKPILDLLPKDVEWDEWAIADSAEVFTGEDLFLYINGGADIYLEYGFIRVVNIRYKNTAMDKIHMEIYEMSDAGAAYGIYTINSPGSGASEDIGDAGMLFDYYLHFVKDNYYVRVTSSSREVAAMNGIRHFARIIEKNIPSKGEKPVLLKAFDLGDTELKNMKYFRGQIALGNIYNFGHGSVAGFSEGIAASADGKMIFVFAYKTGKEGREWFAGLKGKMQQNAKFTDYTSMEDGVTVKDKTGSYLSFKSYGKYFMAIKGMSWEEATPVFKDIMGNLDGIGK
jgi:hypothetical protein